METSLSNEDVNGMVNIMKNDNLMAKIDDLEKNTVNKSYKNPLYISSAEKKERRNKRRRMTWGQKHLYHECKVSTTLITLFILYCLSIIISTRIYLNDNTITSPSNQYEILYFYKLFNTFVIALIQLRVLVLYEESKNYVKTRLYILVPFIILIVFQLLAVLSFDHQKILIVMMYFYLI